MPRTLEQVPWDASWPQDTEPRSKYSLVGVTTRKYSMREVRVETWELTICFDKYLIEFESVPEGRGTPFWFSITSCYHQHSSASSLISNLRMGIEPSLTITFELFPVT